MSIHKTLACIYILAGLMTGCGKDVYDSYYVRYEAELTVMNGWREVTIQGSTATPSGSDSFKDIVSFSETYGPFREGDEAWISVTPVNTVSPGKVYYQKLECSILTRRNSEPFVLMEHGQRTEGDDSFILRCNIGY